MTMLARIETSDLDADRRRANRRLLKLQVPGLVPDRPGVDVVIHDLSCSGLLIETSADLSVGARLEVELPEAGPTEAAVMWADGRYFGCRFDNALPARALSAAQLMSPAACAPAIPGPADAANDRLPLATRIKVVGALALGAWALVLLPVAVAARVIH